MPATVTRSHPIVPPRIWFEPSTSHDPVVGQDVPPWHEETHTASNDRSVIWRDLQQRVRDESVMARTIEEIARARHELVREWLRVKADVPTIDPVAWQLVAALCLLHAERGAMGEAARLWEQLEKRRHPRGSAPHLLAALLAFADRRYNEAEAQCWRALDHAPGDLFTRSFLAETLLAQRRWLDAQNVLEGLTQARVTHPALAFVKALRHGFEVGLYQRLGPFP